MRIADDLRGSKFGDTDYKYATHHELLGVLFFQLVIRTDDDSQLPSDFSGRGGSNTCPTNTHTHVCMYVCIYTVYIYIHIRCACVRTHNTRISAHGYRHNMSFEVRGCTAIRSDETLGAGYETMDRCHDGGQVVNGWRIHPT